MLIPFSELQTKYKVFPKGIIHGGAHFGEEYDDYKKAGVESVIFFEPCTPAFEVLKERFKDHKDVMLANYALGYVHKSLIMNIETVNTGQSNSLLKPKTHLEQYPDIVFHSTEEVTVIPLDHYVIEHWYDMLCLDIQGYELEALKGAFITLKQIKWVYLECNRNETYEGCPMIEEIDAFLTNFTRVETRWASADASWGDCLYIRKDLL